MRVHDEKKRQDGKTKSVPSQQYLTCPTYLAFLSLTVQYDPAWGDSVPPPIFGWKKKEEKKYSLQPSKIIKNKLTDIRTVRKWKN